MSEPASQLLTRNADDLLAYFRRRVGESDAPDLLADTLTTAWRRISTVPTEPDDARAWLFGVAHHTLQNYRRGVRRRNRLADRLRVLLSTDDSAPAADTGLDVRAAIDELGPERAELIRLVHWEGFSLADAAEILGRPASTVRNHYQQAKEQLRVALSQDVLR